MRHEKAGAKVSMLRIPRTLVIFVTNCRIKIMLIHGSMNARFDLEIYCDPILFKRTTLIDHFDLSEFMFFKIRSKGYFDFAIIFFLSLDLYTLILIDILRSLHVKADKLPVVVLFLLYFCEFVFNPVIYSSQVSHK